ncbi:hypothetical protein GCM10009107_52900 [Ideonella azotifigens]|uniref:Transposase Tn5-like N-terminal domain-containing protein n=1 Tax=Ideonella azotifigens TaxID=513160 RepID=A0ABN1KFZ4_9BURK
MGSVSVEAAWAANEAVAINRLAASPAGRRRRGNGKYNMVARLQELGEVASVLAHRLQGTRLGLCFFLVLGKRGIGSAPEATEWQRQHRDSPVSRTSTAGGWCVPKLAAAGARSRAVR